tara:strand:+ start:121 stop:594 length:474 start_codon:yes stop_codon:yes gene_type:complete
MLKVKTFKSTIFKDHRGLYWTSWEKKKHRLNFNHDKFSVSKKNTLRGLHGDTKTWKLVSCVFGKVFFVIINYDKKSKNYLKFKTMILKQGENLQVLIPPLHLNGFLCLSNSCVFHYKLYYRGKYFDVGKQISLKWNDKLLKIKWPKKKNLILSQRDK